MSHIDRDDFVVGQIRLLDTAVTNELALWRSMMLRLSTNDNATPIVRAAANNYLTEATRIDDSPLIHLFMSNFEGKKLVLFWDEFDNTYGRDEIASLLRNTWEEVKSGSLPAFQAVVCLGAYNASLVSAGRSSPFVKDKVYTTGVLNFSAEEVNEIFNQYEKEYDPKRNVDPEVRTNILEITGGHTGLVNACGQVIQHSGQNHVTMDVWEDLKEDLVQSMKNRSVYQAMMQSLDNVQDPGRTRLLLRRLCYSSTGEWYSGHQHEINLLQLGFASVEVRVMTKLLTKEWLVIKSALIKIRHPVRYE